MTSHEPCCVIWACRSGREEFEIFDWLKVESSSKEQKPKWPLQQNELRTQENPSSLRASTTAVRSADARALSCASSASAASVSAAWRCGGRFPGFRSRPGRSEVEGRGLSRAVGGAVIRRRRGFFGATQ